MSTVKAKAKASHREIIFHHDDETPLHFLIDLLLVGIPEAAGRRIQIYGRNSGRRQSKLRKLPG